MPFKENINRICKEQGTNLSQLVKSVGLSTSKVTSINDGNLPSESQIVSFANKLGIEVGDLFDPIENANGSTRVITEHHHSKPKNDFFDLSEDEREIIRIYRDLDRKHQHAFMTDVYEFDDE